MKHPEAKSNDAGQFFLPKENRAEFNQFSPGEAGSPPAALRAPGGATGPGGAPASNQVGAAKQQVVRKQERHVDQDRKQHHGHVVFDGRFLRPGPFPVP